MRISNEYLKGISMFQNKSMSVIDFVSFFSAAKNMLFLPHHYIKYERKTKIYWMGKR